MSDKYELVSLTQSRNIKDFRPLIDTLIPDFDYVFLHTILQWCQLAEDPYKNQNKFWEVYLIQPKVKPIKGTSNKWSTLEHVDAIGICGLYSLIPNSTEQLWLGWFGLTPDNRNKGMGKEAMQFLYDIARQNGCKEILSYVDKEGKPLSFYKREGFEILGTVGEYLNANRMFQIDGSDFECDDDYVIRKFL